MLTTHNTHTHTHTHTQKRELAEKIKAHKHLRNVERKLSRSVYLDLYKMEEPTDVKRLVANVIYSREYS